MFLNQSSKRVLGISIIISKGAILSFFVASVCNSVDNNLDCRDSILSFISLFSLIVLSNFFSSCARGTLSFAAKFCNVFACF